MVETHLSNQDLLARKLAFISYFLKKTYIVGTHQKRLTEALLMSTHNIRFYREIRKIFILY